METIRKQTMKLSTRHLQQQVVNQFGNGTYGGGSDDVFNDETEAMLHEKLERLYKSTRVAKEINCQKTAENMVSRINPHYQELQ